MDKNEIRRNIIRVAMRSREGHIASSFSIVEILISIFNAQSRTKTFSPSNVVLSKGHASYAYYSFLFELGLMSQRDFDQIGAIGSKFYGHVPYIENDARFQYGSGSLGHGLPYSVGRSYARKLKKSKEAIYCIVGDGEANEGTFCESLLYVQKFNLSNINILVDANNSSERAIPIRQTIGELSTSFRTIDFFQCDGHDEAQIEMALTSSCKAKVIVCNTEKGYPVPFMIDNPLWHHKTPSDEECAAAMEYLK